MWYILPLSLPLLALLLYFTRRQICIRDMQKHSEELQNISGKLEEKLKQLSSELSETEQSALGKSQELPLAKSLSAIAALKVGKQLQTLARQSRLQRYYYEESRILLEKARRSLFSKLFLVRAQEKRFRSSRI